MKRCKCGKFLPNNRKMCNSCIRKMWFFHFHYKRINQMNYKTSEKTIIELLNHGIRYLKTKI